LAIHEDQIRTQGAPTKLISDQAQVKISNQVKEILQVYCIDDWQSESHYQHQNFAEHWIQQLKTLVNTIMDHCPMLGFSAFNTSLSFLTQHTHLS